MSYHVYTEHSGDIAQLGLPAGTPRAYLVEFSLRRPDNMELREFSLAIATATSSDIVDTLGATRVERFSHNLKEAKSLDDVTQVALLMEFVQRFRTPRLSSLVAEQYRK